MVKWHVNQRGGRHGLARHTRPLARAGNAVRQVVVHLPEDRLPSAVDGQEAFRYLGQRHCALAGPPGLGGAVLGARAGLLVDDVDHAEVEVHAGRIELPEHLLDNMLEVIHRLHPGDLGTHPLHGALPVQLDVGDV